MGYPLTIHLDGSFSVAWVDGTAQAGTGAGKKKRDHQLSILDPPPKSALAQQQRKSEASRLAKYGMVLGYKLDDAIASGDSEAAQRYKRDWEELRAHLDDLLLNEQSGSTSEARSATPGTSSSLLKDEESKTQATSGLQPASLPRRLLMPTRSFSEPETNCWVLKAQQSETTATTALQASGLTSRLLMPGSPFSVLQQLASNRTITPSKPTSPLGLSMPVKNHNVSQQGGAYCENSVTKRVSRRGYNGITVKGKCRVRSGITLLEERFGSKCLSFVTLTVPVLPAHEYPILNDRWGQVTRIFQQEMVRELERKGLYPECCYVTEIQAQRYRKYGVVVPHIHMVFQGRKYGQHWQISPDRIRAVWGRTLSSVLGHPVDVSVATRIESVKTSVAAYLAKYVSKGNDILDEIKANDPDVKLPSSWWGMTNGLRRQVERSTVRKTYHRLSFEALQEFIASKDYTVYVNEFRLQDGGSILAIYGRVESARRHEFIRDVDEFIARYWGGPEACIRAA